MMFVDGKAIEAVAIRLLHQANEHAVGLADLHWIDQLPIRRHPRRMPGPRLQRECGIGHFRKPVKLQLAHTSVQSGSWLLTWAKKLGSTLYPSIHNSSSEAPCRTSGLSERNQFSCVR